VSEVSAVRFAPDGKILFAGQQSRVKVSSRGAVEAVYGPDESTVESCEIVTWDVATGKARRYHPSLKGPVRDIAVSPDDSKLNLVGGRTDIDEGEAFLWHAGDPDVAASLTCHPGAVRAAAFIDQGRQVVTACDDGSLRFWKVPSPMSPNSLSP
jgi:WD40 repeat protein